MGRFFAIGLMSIYFQYFGDLGPKLLPLILITSLSLTIFALLRTVMPKTVPIRYVTFISGILMILYVGYMRSAVEGLFWISGALQYQAAGIITLLFIIFLVQEKKKDNSISQKTLYRWLTLATLLFAIGSNEVILALIITLVTVLFFWDLLKNKRPNGFYLFVLLIGVVTSLVVILAPGNSVRFDYFPDRFNVWLTLYKTTAHVILDTTYWLFGTPLLFATLILLPVFASLAKQVSAKQSILFNPLLIISTLVILLFIGNGVAVWSTGSGLPDRAKNMLHLFLLLLWFYGVFATLQSYPVLTYMIEKFSTVRRLKIGVVIVFVTTIATSSNITLAWRDIVTSKAAHYNSELDQRYRLITEKRGEAVIEVKPLLSYPPTIFNTELKANEKDWVNTSWSLYFNVSTLRIEQ